MRGVEVYPEGHKRCIHCLNLKEVKEFHKQKGTADGYNTICKVCMRVYQNNRRKNLKSLSKISHIEGTDIPTRAIDIGQQPGLIKRLAQAWIENPGDSPGDISRKTGIPIKQINYFCYFNPYLKAFRELAKKKLSNMIPLALKGIKDCLTSENEKVKLDAATLLLKSERILGTDKIDVTVSSEDERRDMSEIRKIIMAAKLIPEQTIPDDYLIGETVNGTVSNGTEKTTP